jgi:hypothetical protein
MVIRTVRHRLLVTSFAAQLRQTPSLNLWELLRRQKRRRHASLGLSSWRPILINNRDRIQLERWQPGWLVGCPLLTKLRGTNSCRHKPSTGHV